MAEYLELDKVLDDKNIITVQTKEYGSIEVIPVDTITDIELADAKPVKRGKWETWGYIFKGIEWLRCSRCGKPADVSYFKLLEGKIEPATLSICGCCGADMRGEKNDN